MPPPPVYSPMTHSAPQALPDCLPAHPLCLRLRYPAALSCAAPCAHARVTSRSVPVARWHLKLIPCRFHRTLSVTFFILYQKETFSSTLRVRPRKVVAITCQCSMTLPDRQVYGTSCRCYPRHTWPNSVFLFIFL